VSRRVLGALALLLAAVALVGAARGSMTYYQEPSELMESPAGDEVRVGGLVVRGSLRSDGTGVEFVLTDGVTDLPVTYAGHPTSSFREGQGAVVEGRYDGSRLRATRVLVQHSNEYRAPADGAS
jgi:cytochrome c-type biogenesis protein CcmE